LEVSASAGVVQTDPSRLLFSVGFARHWICIRNIGLRHLRGARNDSDLP